MFFHLLTLPALATVALAAVCDRNASSAANPRRCFGDSSGDAHSLTSCLSSLIYGLQVVDAAGGDFAEACTNPPDVPLTPSNSDLNCAFYKLEVCSRFLHKGPAAYGDNATAAAEQLAFARDGVVLAEIDPQDPSLQIACQYIDTRLIDAFGMNGTAVRENACRGFSGVTNATATSSTTSSNATTPTPCATGSIRRKRQTSSQDALSENIYLVQTAVFALKQITAGNATTACDIDNIPTWNNASIDAEYALSLVCPYAFGVPVFYGYSPQNVLYILTDTLAGLIADQNNPSDPARLAACASVDQGVLEMAFLDAPSIVDAVCHPINATTTSTSVVTTVTSTIFNTTRSITVIGTGTGGIAGPTGGFNATSLYPASSGTAPGSYSWPAGTGTAVTTPVAPTAYGYGYRRHGIRHGL